MRSLTRVLFGVLVWQVSAWAADDNIVTNGGFEDPTEGWSLSPAAALSTDKPHAGAGQFRRGFCFDRLRVRRAKRVT